MALGCIWGKAGDQYRHQLPNSINKVHFLDRIWELRLMSSTDPRYRTASEDAYKHLEANDDWEDDYTFLERFDLLNCKEEEYVKFLETVISPDVRLDKDEAKKYRDEIERLLPKGYHFSESIRDDGETEWKLSMANQKDRMEYPQGVPPNTIPFFVDVTPESYPSFQIVTDFWDDFGFKTRSKLYYFDSSDKYHNLGYVKIMKNGKENTLAELPGRFTTLADDFCSLGQSRQYYLQLRKLLPDRFESVLFAIRDAAWYPDIEQEFRGTLAFRQSLMREDATSGILSTVKREILRGKHSDSWSFAFKTKLPYSDEMLDINFELGNLIEESNRSRIQALIGPNGAGKTSILKSLVKGLIRQEEGFSPSRPVFSNIIAISFSIFDTFFNLHSKPAIRYTYCGLHDRENTIMSENDRKDRLKESLRLLNGETMHRTDDRNRFQRFLNALKIVFSEAWVEEIYDDSGLKTNMILDASSRMSSGESMILNLVASLYAHIRPNSLIVFDEMEVHLHPRAIRQMMKLLFKITEQYQSACILATHSSIVVQELLADNVIIVEKDMFDKPITRALNHESLAENLSVISNDIFGEASIQPHYESFVKSVVEYSDTFDEVMNKLSSKGLPPTLPLYMLARNIFDEQSQK